MNSKKTIALLYSKTNNFKKKVNEAKEIIKRSLKVSKKPYVAFSGGKDSTVIYNLVKEFIPEIKCIWSDDEWWLPETDEYIKSINNLIQIRTNAIHTDWFKIKGDYDGLEDYAKQNNYDLVYLGLRAEESKDRKLNRIIKGNLYQVKKEELWHCCPINDWSWKDVWGFIYSNNLNYNKAYDKYDKMGIPFKYQRIGPFAVERVLKYGQLTLLKKGWSSLFNKFCKKYPEAGNLV